MTTSSSATRSDHFRFHAPHAHLASAFGEGWFGEKAEAFARFFGTPKFLIGQTALVAVWIALNAAGVTSFDLYPFILLNLAFSLQAAYAAPLILLAQTRQADRDGAHADADARHREELAEAGIALQRATAAETDQLHKLLEQNTRLTETIAELSRRIAELTTEIHARVTTR
jgi:uncharacterized membrane protein